MKKPKKKPGQKKDFLVSRIAGEEGLWLKLPDSYCKTNDVRQGDNLDLARIPACAKRTKYDHLTEEQVRELFQRDEVPFRNMKAVTRLGHG